MVGAPMTVLPGGRLSAAMVSQTWRCAATSWTRMIRQPWAAPSAVAANEASRRSPISRPSTTPRNVLLEADSNSG